MAGRRLTQQQTAEVNYALHWIDEYLANEATREDLALAAGQLRVFIEGHGYRKQHCAHESGDLT